MPSQTHLRAFVQSCSEVRRSRKEQTGNEQRVSVTWLKGRLCTALSLTMTSATTAYFAVQCQLPRLSRVSHVRMQQCPLLCRMRTTPSRTHQRRQSQAGRSGPAAKRCRGQDASPERSRSARPVSESRVDEPYLRGAQSGRRHATAKWCP
ncbi:hypothetical protein CALCODRAFT_142501 [Calocera cornea HHB12733]|uniref:Uncharacterized protein n=1 Tax=Calocera cornea HHB12733 TaxID=1353952 RepID=A0A165I5T7_9BASI|nr:hypothetical protein CALCODRAFT_142501 [Calocera cornea HHB12733]